MCIRGDVYFIDFGKNIGSKQSGIRPGVVVSNDKANAYSPVVTVVPLTGKIHKKRFLPTQVLIPKDSGSGLRRDSLALAEQVATIDKECLKDYCGNVSDLQIMERLTLALQIQIGAVGS